MKTSSRLMGSLLAIIFLALFLYMLINAFSWLVEGFSGIDKSLIALIVSAIAVLSLIVLGLRSISAIGIERALWQRRSVCYLKLLQDIHNGNKIPPPSSELVLVAGARTISILKRLQKLSPKDSSYSENILRLCKSLRRDLGNQNSTLNDKDLYTLINNQADPKEPKKEIYSQL